MAGSSLHTQVDEAQKALQFVSISSDGNVYIWTMNKSELTHETLMKLRMVGGKAASQADGAAGGGGGKSDAGAAPGGPGDDDTASAAGGCCMDFKKQPGQENIYLVGTEEGCIHRCSKAYSSEYLSTYQGHSLAVYAVKWNWLHHRTFLSASADWSIKLWDSLEPSKPVMSFDLNDSVRL